MTKCRSKKDTVKRVTVQEFIVSTIGLQMIRGRGCHGLESDHINAGKDREVSSAGEVGVVNAAPFQVMGYSPEIRNYTVFRN